MTGGSLLRVLRQFRDPILFGAVPVTFGLLLAFAAYGPSWPTGSTSAARSGSRPERCSTGTRSTRRRPTPRSSWATRRCIRRSSSSPRCRSRSCPSASPPGSGSCSSPRASRRRCGSSASGTGGATSWPSPRRWSSTGSSSGTSRCCSSLPLALAWRYRERARVAGLAVGVAVAAKLFVAPLVVWLLLTRRFRAAAWAVGRPPSSCSAPGHSSDSTGCATIRTLARCRGRLRGAQHLRLDRRRGARRGSTPAARAAVVAGSAFGRRSLARAATRRRPTGVRRRRRRLHRRVADRLAELRSVAAGSDRRDLADRRTGLVLRLRGLVPRRARPQADRAGRVLSPARRAGAGVGLEPLPAGDLVPGGRDADRGRRRRCVVANETRVR